MTEPTDTAVDQVLALVRDRPDLSVMADLTVTLGDTTVTVTSYTDLVRVEIATVGDALRVGRSGWSELGRLARGLAAAGLTAEVRVAGSRVARLGAEANPSPVARRLSNGPVRYHPAGLVGVLLNEL